MIAKYAKAGAGGLANSITYLMGVIPASGGFPDVTTVGWLGTILAFLVGAGVVAAIPKGDEVLRVDSQGELRAGPASRFTTGNVVNENVPMDQLLPKGKT